MPLVSLSQVTNDFAVTKLTVGTTFLCELSSVLSLLEGCILLELKLGIFLVDYY